MQLSYAVIQAILCACHRQNASGFQNGLDSFVDNSTGTFDLGYRDAITTIETSVKIAPLVLSIAVALLTLATCTVDCFDRTIVVFDVLSSLNEVRDTHKYKHNGKDGSENSTTSKSKPGIRYARLVRNFESCHYTQIHDFLHPDSKNPNHIR